MKFAGIFRMNQNPHSDASVVRGALAGALGGLLGSLAMSYAQRLWTLAADGQAPRSAGGKHDAREWQERTEGRNSNELAAQAIATRVAGRALTSDELKVAAPMAHYAFGTAVGAAYGVLVASMREHPVIQGAAFGTAVWIVADEIAMPLLDLSGPPSERPLETHLQSLAAHLVFGVIAETTRQTITAQLSGDHEY
jgi:putative membrane protein